MMGIPPHFAYAMMPMHAAAAMHHLNATQGHRLPLTTGLQPSVSSSNLAHIDSARQSDLSNRLGFKFGPDGSILSENGMPQVGSSTSLAENAAEPTQHNNNLEQFQAHESRLVPSSSRHTLAHDHAFHPGQQGQSTDYDFMMELGMFDGLPPADLYHTAHAQAHAQGQGHGHTSALASSSSNSNSSASVGIAGAGHAFQQVGTHNVMRLPMLTHELPLTMMTSPQEQHGMLLSAAAALRASSPIGKPAVASHAHASLEVTLHTPPAEENERAGSESAGDSRSETEPPLSTVEATAASTAPVVAKGAAVDMACNTMLTYSKIHDALVYYRISDV